MHGVLKEKYKNEAHEKAMSAPINPTPEYDMDIEKRAREAGL